MSDDTVMINATIQYATHSMEIRESSVVYLKGGLAGYAEPSKLAPGVAGISLGAMKIFAETFLSLLEAGE